MGTLEPAAVPVLFLDIDGTVRQGKDDALGRFVNGPEDVVVFPEAIEQMRRWRAKGGRIVGVSNQGGIALGVASSLLVGRAFDETNRQTGNMFEIIAWCTHHPEATDPQEAHCWCRKPDIGLLVTTKQLLVDRRKDEYYPHDQMLMVGDRSEDLGCADRAGIKFMWAADWRAQAHG